MKTLLIVQTSTGYICQPSETDSALVSKNSLIAKELGSKYGDWYKTLLEAVETYFTEKPEPDDVP